MAAQRRSSLWVGLAVSVVLMSTAAPPPGAGRAVSAAPAAPTFNVNAFTDLVADFTNDPDYTICRTNEFNTSCTLRAAIMNANRFVGGGATINLPSGTYVLNLAPAVPNDDSSGDLNITQTVTIVGGGAASTIVDGGGIDRIFFVQAGASASISGVTIRNGRVTSNYGGGIKNDGNLTLDNSTVTGNRAGFSGGGIRNSGDMTLNKTTVSANTARDYGGGIRTEIGATATLNNSTVSGNRAFLRGGGIYADGALTVTNSTIQGNSSLYTGGGVQVDGTARFFHSTITGNLADHDANVTGAGGGIYNNSGQVDLWNTLLAENYVSSIANEWGGSPLISHDYNYFQTTAGCPSSGLAPDDVTSCDPLLGPLQDNGGPTFTRALWVGSPAIDQIPPGLCRDASGVAPVPDQRGVTRPVGPLCDIGAYEGSQPTPLYNRNLIRNGNAENAAGSPSGAYVSTPSWLTTNGEFTAVPYNSPGGFPSVPTDTVPANHGDNFFAGGNAATSIAVELIAVDAISTAIDGGGVRYTLSADLGGYRDRDDNATLTATFLDGSISLAGSPVTIGPVTAAHRANQTGFQYRQSSGLLPAGTRLIQVAVNMTRVGGPYNNGYADNLSLVLTSPTLFLPLVFR